MAKAAIEIRSLARSHTVLAIQTLAGIARSSLNDPARVAAANSLLDRGWGRPATTHTGPDGEGAIRVVIRHIVEGKAVGEPNASTLIDVTPEAANVLEGPWQRQDDEDSD